MNTPIVCSFPLSRSRFRRTLSPRDKIRRRQRARYRIGQVLAFISSAAVWLLNRKIALYIAVVAYAIWRGFKFITTKKKL